MEQRCIRRAQGGAVEAWGELYDLHAARIYRCIVYPLVGDASSAEDVLAETFRAAFAKLGDFQPGKVSIYFWLARIARNKAMDLHRKRQAHGRALQGFSDLLLPLQEDQDSPEQQLSREVSHAATVARVHATLDELNPRYRTAIELRFFQELPRELCAEQMGIQVGTFDVVLLRSLRAFRKRWMAAAPDSQRPLEAHGE